MASSCIGTSHRIKPGNPSGHIDRERGQARQVAVHSFDLLVRPIWANSTMTLSSLSVAAGHCGCAVDLLHVAEGKPCATWRNCAELASEWANSAQGGFPQLGADADPAKLGSTN